ncbi:hypothetical protein PC116_g26200 [Phytophthora cactorum]|nr:hypothetical protein Pcac1_g14225 [Phytophthora cactorum]KAG2975117.1 hypothetical protein PC119_g22531 [Phytophthora cactorum]KAG4225374.1 hypothetical protein PC116_g26200 [Phytophthora cactorum]
MGSLLEKIPARRRPLIVARLPRWRYLIQRRWICVLRRGSLRSGITFRRSQVDPAQGAIKIRSAKTTFTVAVRLGRGHYRLHFAHWRSLCRVRT